jgi:hypothetical protein
LKNVFAFLGEMPWLNDDVVIPLLVRALYPEGVILYPVGEIKDSGVQSDSMDVTRRKRILQGNLQWIRMLWPQCCRLNPVAGVVAVRRLFRVFWAYWIGLAALGLASFFHIPALPALAVMGILMVLSGSFRQLVGAAWVSLTTPFQLVLRDGAMREAWK